MKHLIPCLLLATAVPLMAQFDFNSKVNSEDRGPTYIKADSMGVDLEKKITTFYGNVVVNDPEIVITCQKMVLYQVPKKTQVDPKNLTEAEKAKLAEEKRKEKDSLTGNSKLERIECIGNVVMTRKTKPGEKSEWGTCGKAVYYQKDGRINMIQNPVLHQDDSTITGIRLTYYRDSKRVEGTGINIQARNFSQEKKDPNNPENSKKGVDPKKKKTDKKPEDFNKFYKNEEPKAEKKAMTQQEKDSLLGLDKVQ